MKLRDFHYRDLEDKFVKVLDSNNALLKLGIGDLKHPFVGFTYFDDKRGLTFRVISDMEGSLIDKYLYDKIKLAPYEIIEDFDIEIMEDFEFTSKEKAQNHLKINDDNKTIHKVRKRTEIDSLRSRTYPDDVNIIIPYSGGYVEKIWARSYDYIKKENTYILSLLKDSVYDENLKKGTLVACKYFKNEKAQALIFLGVVEVV